MYQQNQNQIWEPTNESPSHIIKDISEIKTRLLRSFGIGVPNKLVESLQSILCKPKNEITKEHVFNIIYKIHCFNCEKH